MTDFLNRPMPERILLPRELLERVFGFGHNGDDGDFGEEDGMEAGLEGGLHAGLEVPMEVADSTNPFDDYGEEDMVLWGDDEGGGQDEGDPSHVPPPVNDVVSMDIRVQTLMPLFPAVLLVSSSNPPVGKANLVPRWPDTRDGKNTREQRRFLYTSTGFNPPCLPPCERQASQPPKAKPKPAAPPQQDEVVAPAPPPPPPKPI